MPYVFVSTRRRLVMECGPTCVGDAYSDKSLMEYLGATMKMNLGNNFYEYETPDPPRLVLDKLEERGFKLVSMTGVGQTCVWTLHSSS